MPTDTVQDGRRRNFFMLDNDLIDRYGPVIGVYGLSVYAALVRLSQQKGECWPAHDTIAKRLDMSVTTVKKAINVLVDAGLIKVSGRTGDGLKTSNVYTLLPLTPPTPAAAPATAEPQPSTAGLWDSVIGPVTDAPDHGGKLKALHKGWRACFGAEAGITPAQMQQLVTAAGGDYVVVARAALRAAAGVHPIGNAFALVRSSLTRQYPGKATTPRKEAGQVGYGTVSKAREAEDDETPF